MQRFIDAIRYSIAEKNWFAAIFIALALPDICGALEKPKAKVGDRYKNWFDRYLAENYKPKFSADDCYYFRCACLHQGFDTHDRMKFEKIHFTPPDSHGSVIHKNRINNILQMQIDVFCEDLCKAVERWCEDTKDDSELQVRKEMLMKIHPTSSVVPIKMGG